MASRDLSDRRWWETRAAVISVAFILWLGLILFYTSPAWAMTIYRLIVEGAVLGLWLGAAAGAGSLLVALLNGFDESADERLLRLTTATALGLGLFSLIALGLGLAGWLNQGTAIALLACGLIAGGTRLITSARCGGFHTRWLAEPAGWGWLLLLGVPFVSIMTAGALLPPYLLWSPNEPHGYDVVEYHLQVPREWYEAGRIIPLHHNVFSFFPFNVEMHYLLAMHLRGGPWAGMYLAQLMHGAMILLSVLAACGFANRLAQAGKGPITTTPQRIAPVLTALAMLTTPWLAQLGAIAYDEGGFLLFGILTIGWAATALRESKRRVSRFALAGVMAGFACGSKLTAVPEILVAICALSVLFLAIVPSKERLVARLSGPIIFGVAGLLCFSPWLIRDWAWTGNPLFPEMPSLLGKGHFSDVQVERWRHAHQPQPAQQQLAGRVKALWTDVLASWQFGYFLVPMAVLAIVIKWKDSDVWFLGAMLFLLTVFWLGFTHLQSRFFILAVPICALLIARLPWPIGLVIGIQAIVGFTILNQQYVKAINRFPPLLFGQVVGTDNLSWMPPVVVDSVPPEARLTLVGDAKAFLYQRPMSLLSYRTIFDVDTSRRIDVIDAWAGPASPPGSQWICVDPGELKRFEKTYQPFPPLSREILAHDEPYLMRR
jgi:hypothetical protein